MKKANLINFPHFNDCGGDLKKKWYVEYSFVLPGESKKYRYRIYDGLCSGTKKQRTDIAKQLIEQINRYLKSGAYLDHPEDYRAVQPREDYRPETQTFQKAARRTNVEILLAKMLKERSVGWGSKTLADYKSKYKYFLQWANEVNLQVKDATRKDVEPYFYWYANRGVSRATIKKAAQVVHIFFDWLEEIELRPEGSNPVRRVPKLGTIVNNASVPFTKDERKMLRDNIAPRDPWLWLACEMQYYCAIRPGTELRLAQIKHINLERKTITIPSENAKANRTDIVGLPENIVEQMQHLGLFNWPEEYYIFGKFGVPSKAPLGKNTLRNRFNKYRDELGISPDRKFYSWKHTGAIQAVDNGIGIWDLKQHMRHKSITTTEEYLQNRAPDVHKPGKYITGI